MPMSPEERQRRRHQRSAARKNAKIIAEIPLFADQVHGHDARSEFWHWRRNRAEAAERLGVVFGGKGLSALRVNMIRRFACNVLGAELFEKLDTYCRRVHSDLATYGYGFWTGVFAGDRVVFSWRRDETWTPGCGRPQTVPDDFYQHRTMSREEFWEMFPYRNPEPPDDVPQPTPPHPAPAAPAGQ